MSSISGKVGIGIGVSVGEGKVLEIAGRVAEGWLVGVNSGVGVSGLILGVSVDAGLKVDRGAASGVLIWVGGGPSVVQPSRTRMVKAVISSLIK